MNPGIERFIGRLLRSKRAGDRYLAWNDPRAAGAPDTIQLTSRSFVNGGPIPERHAGVGVGDNVSPSLEWQNAPPGAVELVLVVQDPDAPMRRPVIHLIALGLKPGPAGAAEGAFTSDQQGVIAMGKGFMGRVGYAGPRPVRGHGPHRYVFQLFAVGMPLKFTKPPTLEQLFARIGRTILARGRLTGTYERT